MVYKLDPSVMQSQNDLGHDGSTQIFFDEHNFQFAFGVSDWDDLSKDDPELVEWVPIYHVWFEGDDEGIEIPLTFHKCTDQDWDKFYPFNEIRQVRIETLKKNNVFFCFD